MNAFDTMYNLNFVYKPPDSPKLKDLSENSNSTEGDQQRDGLKRQLERHKQKTYKCKICFYKATTKEDHWIHLATHIKREKRRHCPTCPFVTKWQNHLTYHMNQHKGSKPFKCDECEYAGATKAMLTSHKKSHSNLYQYRCRNCNYASKHYHQFKVHLRKNQHQPGMILNPDGTPNLSFTIDLYRNERGQKRQMMNEPEKDQVDVQNVQNEMIIVAVNNAPEMIGIHCFPHNGIHFITGLNEMPFNQFSDEDLPLDLSMPKREPKEIAIKQEK